VQPRKLSELPGPRGLPILGNLLQLRNSRLHLTAEAWSRTYGEYFRFRIGPQPFLAVANPETIAALLRDRPDGFHRSERLSAIADDMGFNGVFSANGEAWRRQRPMVMASFDPRHIKTYFGAGEGDAALRDRWQRAAASRAAIDLQADLMRYTVDVTAGLAFGADINTLESDREVIQSHLDKVFPALFKRLMAPFPYWRWFRNRRLDRHLEALRRAVADFIARARERMEADPKLRERPTNLIEAMIAARDNPGSRLDDADVAGNVMTMLLAGEDTTANTLAWMIYLLHRNPDALARARDEVWGKIWRNTKMSLRCRSSMHQRDHAAEAGGADHHAATDARYGGRRHRGAEGHAPHVPDARRRDRRAALPRRARVRSGTLASGRLCELAETGGDAVRRRAASLPGALSRAAGDEDGGGVSATSTSRPSPRRRRCRSTSPTMFPVSYAQAKRRARFTAALDARTLREPGGFRAGTLTAPSRDVAVHRRSGSAGPYDVLAIDGRWISERGLERPSAR
jgi:cytochrome P450